MSFRNPLTSPVTVTGNVGITGTPNVAVTNTPNVGLPAGTQLSTGAGLSLQNIGDQLLSGDLGTGSDGAVTISSNTTLTRDMNYSSLTVNNAVILSTGGYVIRCTGTVAGTGIIDNSGTAATATAAGVGGVAGTLPGGANGVFMAGASTGALAGNAPVAADVQGGPGGSSTGPGGTGAGGAVTASSALGGSVAGLRSLRYGGGASGAMVKQGGVGCGTGGGGGAVIVICATFNGPTVQANAGAAFRNGAINTGCAGSGGGTVFVFCRSFQAGTVQATGSAADNNGTNTGNPGSPGRAAVVTTS